MPFPVSQRFKVTAENWGDMLVSAGLNAFVCGALSLKSGALYIPSRPEIHVGKCGDISTRSYRNISLACLPIPADDPPQIGATASSA